MTSKQTRFLVLVAAVLSATSVVRGQSFPDHSLGAWSSDPSLRISGDSPVRGIGDIDGDGFPDCAVQFSSFATGLLTWNLYSGRTGIFVRTLSSTLDAHYVDYVFEEVGDLDGDGVRDFVEVRKFDPLFTPAQDTPEARAISGANGMILWSADVADGPTYGISRVQIASIGDGDGDGVGEVVILAGNPDQFSFMNGSPAAPTRLHFLSGATGNVVNVIVDGLNIIDSIANAGDADGDGDGEDDLIIGASTSPFVGPNAGGAALLSGATYQYLRFWNGAAAGERFATGVSGAGDVNGDGLDDVIISSQGALLARVYSSADGSVLHAFPLPAATPSSAVPSIVPSAEFDWNGDGVRDHVLREPILKHHVRSGADFSVLADLGFFGKTMGDGNGDGIPEALIVDYYENPQSVRIVSHRGAEPYGVSTGGLALQWLPFAATPTAGRLRLSGGAPFASVVLAVSLQPALFQFFQGLPLYVSPAPEHLLLLESPTLGATGVWEIVLSLEQPALDGVILYLQGGAFGTSPSTSNGLQILFEESGA
ncbi:MAG: VCBS repeat-containing protein [Planctomycetota bacterium]